MIEGTPGTGFQGLVVFNGRLDSAARTLLCSSWLLALLG